MGEQVSPSSSEAAPDREPLTAGTFGTVAEHRQRVAAAQIREGTAATGPNNHLVEHERQSRLRSWQRLG